MEEKLRVIISGGGTGGHIFPALSIADAIKAAAPQAEILFVGAESRMEMQRVPAAGYPIKGLPVYGFDRKRLWRNVKVLYQLLKSQRMAHRIIKEFGPHIAIGVGGYASGPTLKEAGRMGIPTLLQEQNSYAGVTNKLLSKQAHLICVAYEGMQRFFPADKIKLTGNPVRQNLLTNRPAPAEARRALGLDPQKPTLLMVGGSLGAGSLNRSVLDNLQLIAANPQVQILWQTGKYYAAQCADELKKKGCPQNLKMTEFIADMGSAYAAANLVVSRAGAGSISEFCLLGKAVILVPSPNVAEDHQTKNAMALVERGAAIHIKDAEAGEKLIPQALRTLSDTDQLKKLSDNILKLALPHSAETIAAEAIKIAKNYRDK